MMIYTKKIPKDSIQTASPPSVTQVSNKLADDFVDGKVTSIRHLWKILGKEKFHIIAYQVIIGNQIIILCDDEELVASIIKNLKVG